MQRPHFPGTVPSMLVVTVLVLTSLAATTRAHAQFTDIYDFGTNAGDPSGPKNAGVISQGRDGNFYTSSPDGLTDGKGSAFKITLDGVVTVLHRFHGTDGLYTSSGLTMGTDGNFYGTTAAGGRFSSGTVFKVTADGAFTTLHSFNGVSDGGSPGAPPIEGFDGNFYGITSSGGSVGNTGTVYRITPTGAFKVLHTFGAVPGPCLDLGLEQCTNAALLQGSDGFLYGTTIYGGTHDLGTIFKMDYAGGYFKTLYDFDGTHGDYPMGSLIEGDDGFLYGTTEYGTVVGVAFKIKPTGSLTILYSFSCQSPGSCDQAAGLTLATDGNFYGTNTYSGPSFRGSLYQLTPEGGFGIAHRFAGFSIVGSDGAIPESAVVQHTNGLLYGDTYGGGAPDAGIFYSQDMGMGPFVRFLPVAGKPGDTIELLGQGFTGTTSVAFNGATASFSVVSDTYLTANVPDGATGGSITVVTPGGALTSNRNFVVNQPPAAGLDLTGVAYPTPPTQDNPLTYAFQVLNNTAAGAVNEVLTTQTPSGTTFSGVGLEDGSTSEACTTPAVGGTGAVVCHENGTMPAGSTWTIRLTVQVAAPSTSVLTQSATASSDNEGRSSVTVNNTVK